MGGGCSTGFECWTAADILTPLLGDPALALVRPRAAGPSCSLLRPHPHQRPGHGTDKGHLLGAREPAIPVDSASERTGNRGEERTETQTSDSLSNSKEK